MLQIREMSKSYRMGDVVVKAIDGVSLSIERGDFVAIMGPSGSGKSTLMHVLGLLDVPESGTFTFDGEPVATLSDDALAELRRSKIGFVFQDFNLLSRMTALENVALPMLYSERRIDEVKAHALLNLVGLGERSEHFPNQLSGGQQQRVAIARSLVNSPHLILADEPTGNLDSKSEREIIELFKKLNANGITVVVITHEEEVGKEAKRIIRMRDGRILSDVRHAPVPENAFAQLEVETGHASSRFQHLIQHFRQAAVTLLANKVRASLSMLGVLMAVAAVITILAIGSGARKQIKNRLAVLGNSLIEIGVGGGTARDSGPPVRLTLEDLDAISNQVPFVQNTTAKINQRGQVAFQGKSLNTTIAGRSSTFPELHNSPLHFGRFFTEHENLKLSRVAVLGESIQRQFFGSDDPVGKVIKVNRIEFEVIGSIAARGGYSGEDDVVYLPVRTAMSRLLGRRHIDSIEVQVDSPEHMNEVQEGAFQLISARHRIPASRSTSALFVRNSSEWQAAITSSNDTITLLLTVVAAISLLVGGIGIMNIMLVSVTERTPEIGLRKAIGGRKRDILFQFLLESALITGMGGLLGIALACAVTFSMAAYSGWVLEITLSSVLVSIVFSVLIGIVFGMFPAMRASALSPIEALRSN